MAIILAGSMMKQSTYDKKTMKFEWPSPVFSKTDFVEKSLRLLSDPKFTENAVKQRALSRLSGGAKKAVQAIEAGYLHYTSGQYVDRDGIKLMEPSHLVDNDYYEATQYWSFCKCCCGLFCILPGLILALLLAGFPGIINFATKDY